MALLTSSEAGDPITYVAAAAGGDTYANTGRERVHVVNGGGAPITVTFRRTKACDQGVVHAPGSIAADAFTVDDGSDAILPAVDPNLFGVTTEIEYSAVTSVTVGVIE